MVVCTHPFAPALGHPPLALRYVLRADQEVGDFYRGIGVLMLRILRTEAMIFRMET